MQASNQVKNDALLASRDSHTDFMQNSNVNLLLGSILTMFWVVNEFLDIKHVPNQQRKELYIHCIWTSLEGLNYVSNTD